MRWVACLAAGAAVLLAAPAFAHGPAPVATSGPAAFLALGFFIGIAHALEADHMTAVASMMERGESRRSLVARGAVWGAGHTLALFVICSVVLLLGLTISGRVEAALEAAVGLLIAALGLRVLWRIWRDRVHVHVHSHGGKPHVHVHSHAGEEGPHSASSHDHAHPARARGHAATLGVGVLHGAAGSAGLLVLTVAAADSILEAIGYFAVFGAGTMIGMTLFSAAVSYPLHRIHQGARWMRSTVNAVIGGAALLVGGTLAAESLAALQVASL
ncbi:hypothetical protein [Citreimonas sp.]|uniref:hypothetical protein n=1 Tax=Citreimonas sp. TaxID=3036715 RepID=UPI004058925B